MAQKTKAVHEIRFGYIKVAIWRSSGRAGERHSVTACRLYRDGDTWRQSTSYPRDSLLLLAKAIDLAHTWICEHSGVDDPVPKAKAE